MSAITNDPITQPLQTLAIAKGVFAGAGLITSSKNIGQLQYLFLDGKGPATNGAGTASLPCAGQFAGN